MNDKLKIGLILLAIMSLVLVPEVSALPEYANVTGASCGICHVSATGGGILTPVGDYYLQNGQLNNTTTLATPVITP